jgi:hypothetical protein
MLGKPARACISGLAVGCFILFIGILTAPPPANELAIPKPAIHPGFILLAAAMAAAVPAYRMGASGGMSLALGLGAAVCTYFMSIWVTHWAGVGTAVMHRPVNAATLVLRRDLGVSFLGVAVGSFLGMMLGRR